MRQPTPAEVRSLLDRHGLTQAKAARLIGRNGPRSMNRWCSEADATRMPVDAAIRLWAACGETWTGDEQ